VTLRPLQRIEVEFVRPPSLSTKRPEHAHRSSHLAQDKPRCALRPEARAKLKLIGCSQSLLAGPPVDDEIEHAEGPPLGREG
jgi:hypothetical protein